MTSLQQPHALRARWLFSAAGEPLADGVLTLQGERIVAVGGAPPGCPVEDLGNVTFAGLIDAHTHPNSAKCRRRWAGKASD